MNIDWKLLRQQKITLIKLSESSVLFQQMRDDLNGLISFLDAYQDEAAEELGDKVVFGGQ